MSVGPCSCVRNGIPSVYMYDDVGVRGDSSEDM